MICHKPSEEAILQKISFNQYLLQSQKEGIQVSEYTDCLSVCVCVYTYTYKYKMNQYTFCKLSPMIGKIM